MFVICTIFALTAGVLISTQGTINNIAGKEMGIPAMIACLSLIQAVPALFYLLIRKPSGGLLTGIVQGFKWSAAAGAAGVIILALLTFSISKIGALSAFVILVLGQILGAAIIDHFGLFGVEVKQVNLLKLASIAIIIVGVFLLIKSEPTQSAETGYNEKGIQSGKKYTIHLKSIHQKQI